MTRLLTLLAIGYFAWQFVKNYLNKQEIRQKRQSERSQQTPLAMVQCQYCRVHLPGNEAVAAGNNWFCGNEHKNLWLKSQQG